MAALNIPERERHGSSPERANGALGTRNALRSDRPVPYLSARFGPPLRRAFAKYTWHRWGPRAGFAAPGTYRRLGGRTMGGPRMRRVRPDPPKAHRP